MLRSKGLWGIRGVSTPTCGFLVRKPHVGVLTPRTFWYLKNLFTSRLCNPFSMTGVQPLVMQPVWERAARWLRTDRPVLGLVPSQVTQTTNVPTNLPIYQSPTYSFVNFRFSKSYNP